MRRPRTPRASCKRPREAVSHYRSLARHAPGEFEQRLAVALSNVGNCLAVHLDRASEALAPADEAVRILRDHDETDPNTHTGALAAALATLSRAAAAWGNDALALDAAEGLWRTGRTDEALASLEESVAIERELVRFVPDRFEPMLSRRPYGAVTSVSGQGRVFRAQRDQHIEEHHHPCPAEPANEWLGPVPHSVRVPPTAELGHIAQENARPPIRKTSPPTTCGTAQAPQAMSWTLCSVRSDACRAMVP